MTLKRNTIIVKNVYKPSIYFVFVDSNRTKIYVSVKYSLDD